MEWSPSRSRCDAVLSRESTEVRRDLWPRWPYVIPQRLSADQWCYGFLSHSVLTNSYQGTETESHELVLSIILLLRLAFKGLDGPRVRHVKMRHDSLSLSSLSSLLLLLLVLLVWLVSLLSLWLFLLCVLWLLPIIITSISIAVRARPLTLIAGRWPSSWSSQASMANRRRRNERNSPKRRGAVQFYAQSTY